METIINPTQDEIRKAAKALKDGHLVAFPTETVYGLGADANNKKAVSRVYSVKGRPTGHPLIVHISSTYQLDKWARDIPDYAIRLAKKFWPGPMTLILKRSELAEDFVTGGQTNVGLRVPNHLFAQALVSEFEKLGGYGLAAPSANRFGAVSPTTSEAVEEELGSFLKKGDLILDGGHSTIGVESSIIDCTKDYPVLLRPGSITAEMIELTIDYKIPFLQGVSNVRAPGILESHYSPKAEVVIDSIAAPGDGLIAMANTPTPPGVIRLACPTSIEQYAREVYEALRTADKKGIKKIIAVQPKGNGLALAIRDRLGKAASR